MNKALGFSALFFSALAFGTFGIWIRLLNQEMSIYQQVVLRNGFAFIFAILIVIFTRQLKNINWSKVKKLNLFFYILLVPLAVIAYNVAMLNTKIALATFAFYVGTILTGWVVGIFFFHEKLNAEKWISLTLVLIGIALFAFPFTNRSINLGLIAGVISGVLDGSANGFRKDLSGKISKVVLVSLTAVGGVLISGFMMSYFNQSLSYLGSISTTAWIIGGLFGALLVIVNYLLLVGFKNFDLGLGSIVLSLELFFALIFGAMVFGEYPTGMEIAGGVFILLANIVPNVKMIFLSLRLKSKKLAVVEPQ
ncbi:DMT family transporter [Patescibacteria group bacterium]|nr:DMT family transporter [Patescibacteria group bacterium]